MVHRAWLDLDVELPSQCWYQIPAELVHDAVTYSPPEEGVGDTADPAQVALFDPRTGFALDAVPVDTLAHYRRLATRGLRGAWFAGVPHVLMRGSIDTTELTTIDWAG
ncbi:MAG: hypothetical protein L0G99_11375 [Propionibacteriales bacterium]|nr:hypothetical protein [Propionibacteriales bacterium]